MNHPATNAPTLGLIRRLVEALDEEAIRYCHWKSNQGLHRALAGDTDLDLLIDPQQRFHFSRTLVRLGFKKARGSHDGRYPGIVHFYGYDRDSGKIVDVHAHFRLVVGSDLLKNYELPLSVPLIRSRATVGGMWVPSVEFEYLVFVVRMALKRRLLAWLFGRPDIRFHLQAFSRRGRPGLVGTEAEEYEDFQARVEREAIPGLLAAHLPEVGEELFHACERSIASDAGRWDWLTAGHRLAVALKPYQRCSTLRAVGRAMHRSGEILVSGIRRRAGVASNRSKKRRLTAGGRLIAFVGGDGSGKTTNLESAASLLGQTFEVHTLHLGKPPFGPVRVLYLLVSKAIRIPMGDPREKAVKPLHAITHILVARGRWKLAKRAASLTAAGSIVLADRYPTGALERSEAPSIPLIEAPHSRLVQRLSGIERRYYDKIGNLPRPDLIVVLDVDPEVAIERKPEDPPDFIRPRLQEIRTVKWQEVGNATVIDASQPLETVLDETRNLVWSRLPGWSPQIEIAGVAGTGKTTLIAELMQGGLFVERRLPRFRWRVLREVGGTSWAFARLSPPTAWALATKLGVLRFWERRLDDSRLPVIHDHGPLFLNAHTLSLLGGEIRNRRLRDWHLRQVARAHDILDLVIPLEAGDEVVRDRIDTRANDHVIKGIDSPSQVRFLNAYRTFFEAVQMSRFGDPAVSVVTLRTDARLPGDLASDVVRLIH